MALSLSLESFPILSFMFEFQDEIIKGKFNCKLLLFPPFAELKKIMKKKPQFHFVTDKNLIIFS